MRRIIPAVGISSSPESKRFLRPVQCESERTASAHVVDVQATGSVVPAREDVRRFLTCLSIRQSSNSQDVGDVIADNPQATPQIVGDEVGVAPVAASGT